MDAKTYLSQVRNDKQRMEQLNWELKYLNDELVSLHASVQKESLRKGSPKKSGFADQVDRLYDLQSYMTQVNAALTEQRETIALRIMGMENPKYREVLYDYYILGLNLTEVSERMDLGYDRVKHLHLEALRAFERTYPEIRDLPEKDWRKIWDEGQSTLNNPK